MTPKVSKEEFLKHVINELVASNLDENAVSSIDPSKLQVKYLWGYQYSGSAECNYSARVANNHTVKIEYGSKSYNGEIKSGTPVKGHLDDLTFDIVVPSITDKSPYWAERIDMSLLAENLHEYKEGEIPACDIIDGIADSPLDYWLKKGNDVVDKLCTPIAEGVSSNAALIYQDLGIVPLDVAVEIAKSGTLGTIDVVGVSVQTRNKLFTYGNRVLIPFYLLEFEYKNRPQYIVGTTDGSNYLFGNIPMVTHKNPEEILEEEMADKMKTVKMAKYGWIIALLALFVAGFTTAVVLLIVWYVALYILKMPIKKREKELKEEQGKRSLRIEAMLKKQFNV